MSTGTAKKFKLICHLIVTTPRYQMIMLLQLVSGVASTIGLPMLLPVLDYMRNEPIEESALVQPVTSAMTALGIPLGFHSILIVASVLILLGQGLVFISSLCANNAQVDILKQYRADIFHSYSKADWLWLCNNRSGEMNYTVLREADLASVAHLNAQRVMISFVQVVVLLMITIKLSPTITLAAFGVYGFVGLISAWNAGHIQKLSHRANELYKDMANALSGMQQNKKFFKTALLNEQSLQAVYGNVEEIAGNAKGQNFRVEMQNTFSFVITVGFLISLMFFHEQFGLTYSTLLLILLIFLRLAPQFSALATAYAALDGNIPMYESTHKRLADLHAHSEKNGTQAFDPNGPVVFKNVGYSYPNGTKVFEGLNAAIEPRKATAFIGPSGVGKSTLLDLFLGLLAPTSGQILYGTVAHNDLDKETLRAKVAYVSQETTLVDGTLKENLTIMNPHLSDDEVMKVVDRVGLRDAVARMEEGLNTPIGENGIKLSGGQRQRVALARALFMNPSILVLDEATSSLDAETELLIQQTIKNLSADLTVIIVTHKLNSIKFADRIYVLEAGKVSESGSFTELLNQAGKFQTWNSLQK